VHRPQTSSTNISVGAHLPSVVVRHYKLFMRAEPMRTLLSTIFIILFSTPLLARDYDVKTGVNLLCEELDAKSYYADVAMQNVKKKIGNHLR